MVDVVEVYAVLHPKWHDHKRVQGHVFSPAPILFRLQSARQETRGHPDTLTRMVRSLARRRLALRPHGDSARLHYVDAEEFPEHRFYGETRDHADHRDDRHEAERPRFG